MKLESHPDSTVAVDVDAGPPTWEQLRAEQLVVVDDEFLKLAVYVGAEGALVVMTQEFDERQPRQFFVEYQYAPRLIETLAKAHAAAKIIAANFDNEIAAGEASK